MTVSPIYTITAAVTIELKQREKYEVIDSSKYYYLLLVNGLEVWVRKDDLNLL